MSETKFRVFEPFPAYIEYLKRNNIPFQHKKKQSANCIEFDTADRFKAKEDYVGLCGMSGYIYALENGQEKVIQTF